ncbi:MAG: zf-HC2 domain-containing protein [Candidatus Riflebacteria bacterium]|nr:zf-HC2 domain-containing protein [Candidatus Riflebacteria bacterium]
MNCEKIQELIPDSVSGGLSPEDNKAVPEHLKSCSVCRKEVEKQKALVSGMNRFYESFEPGKQNPVFSIPEEKKSSSNWRALWTWGSGFSLAAVIGIFIYFQFYGKIQRSVVTNSGSIQVQSVHKGESLLQSGVLLDLARNEKLQKGFSLLAELPYKAVEEAGIEHNKRMFFTMASGTSFEMVPEGVLLIQGGGRFDVQPGANRIRVKTACAILGVLGTKFDVVANERLTIVQLLRGKIQVEAGKQPFIMEPGDVTCTFNGSETRKIQLSEDLWSLFSRDPGNWEAALNAIITQKSLSGGKSGSPGTKPDKSNIASPPYGLTRTTVQSYTEHVSQPVGAIASHVISTQSATMPEVASETITASETVGTGSGTVNTASQTSSANSPEEAIESEH